MTATPITPVLLSGGSGTRLWPLSLAERPKQFLALTCDATMFELTLTRTLGLNAITTPVIVANAAHEALLADQLDGPATVILEPCARNTAPAIALAALALADPDHLMLVMPSDHVIADVAAFHAAIEAARPMAAQDWLVTFGITPDAPETGYGYIALGDAVAPGVQQVEHFVEKPDRDKAATLLVAGGHVWNAGIFLFSGRAYLDALRKQQPAMATAAQNAMMKATRRDAVIAPDADAFATSPSDSIDYAVMEGADKVACVPVSMGWSDVGSWDSLYAIADKTSEGHVLTGRAQAIESNNCLVRGEGIRVTLAGVNDLIVVATGDEVIVLPRGHSQDIKKIVDLIKIKG